MASLTEGTPSPQNGLQAASNLSTQLKSKNAETSLGRALMVSPVNHSGGDGLTTLNRVLVASSNVKQNDIVLEIPITCTVSSSSFDQVLQSCLEQSSSSPEETEAKKSDIFRSLQSSSGRVELKKQVLLLLHATIAPQGCESFWQPYVASLPPLTSFHHVPFYWEDQEIQKYGPCFARMLRSMCQRFSAESISLHEELKYVVELLSQYCPSSWPSGDCAKTFQLDFVEWCMCTCNSRTFDLVSIEVVTTEEEAEEAEDKNDDRNDPGLIPFVDLCNHSENATLVVRVERNEQGNRVARARATRDVAENEELTIRYFGKQEMVHFLFYYGFVPTPTTSTNSNGSDVCESVYYHVQYDGVDVGLDVNKRDQGSNHLLSALASLGLPPTDDFALQGTAEAPFPEEWIWLLRIREIWNDCKKR